MDEKFSELLAKLGSVVREALCSEDIIAAMAALEHAGHQINASLDVTIIKRRKHDDSYQTAAEDKASFPGTLELSASDKLFLAVLNIAVE